MEITVRRLRPDDDRTAFRSGDVELDRFLHRYAGQNQFKHHIGTTYVAVDDRSTVLGFVTVSPAEIEVRDLPKTKRRRLPAYPLPALRLARLAVAEPAQGRGVGLHLLKAVFVLARRMAHGFGCVGVLVDAKPNAVRFYEQYGFVRLSTLQGMLGDRPEPTLMFLDLRLIPQTEDEPPGD